MEGRRRIFYVIGIILAAAPSLSESVTTDETCDEIIIHTDTYQNNYNNLWHVWSYIYGYDQAWFNMSFWGGHSQIPSKDNVDDKCFASWAEYFVALLEKHPDIANIDNNVVTLQACNLNRNRVCEWNIEIEARKCNGDLLYRFPWLDAYYDNPDSWYQYICLDRIYANTCSDTTMLYSAGNVEGDIIKFNDGDIQTGWYSGFINGKQYVYPSTEDLEFVIENCFDGYGYVLQEPVPLTITETPVRLDFCYVYTDTFYSYNSDDDEYHISDDENGNCYNHVYARVCNGKLQFDLTFMQHWLLRNVCFIHKSNVFVNPEIRHSVAYIEIDGKPTKEYSPFLQYRCSFDMTDGVSYTTNWYINGTWKLQTGPSVRSDDLVFKEEYLNDLPPGYEVQCGVLSDSQSNESLSDVFYAGWKVSDNSIDLKKSGYAIVKFEQTIPMGCYYTDNENPLCSEELFIADPSYNPEVCAGGIRVQDAGDTSKSYFDIKSLKDGEKWTNKIYRAKLFTKDSDYDDKTTFNLDMSVTRSTGHANRRAINTEILGSVHVVVTDNNRHWNKRCYSHVDPHHMTQDGQHFEMQVPGDHMMYLNDLYQTEIQQSARYCYPGMTTGPVCACGIAIRVGADAFVINKCPDSHFVFDFTQCGDGGIIDIEKVHDYRYKVRTPIGTIVDIFLHTWSDTMNIDIYMSAKDFGNVVGLCGYFDGDSFNDLLHRDRVTVSDDSNRSYMFSDSWKLTDEENLFKNEKRYLAPWNVDNGGDSGQACRRPNSITKKKCKVPRRKRRSLSNRLGNEQKSEQPRIALSRTKRSTTNFTENEAFEFCNQSIYMTPAVVEFPDKLAGEDPDIVVEQCVYDLIQGNDTAWVNAHTTVLNNAADAILKLNPVYVANNSEIVNSFFTKMCLNNCSQNGACTETGLCECTGTFRGPSCSIDIRIPPLVYEIQGGDICDTSDGDDCTCFQIRTDNIFDGFMCNMTKYKVYFNGTRVWESTAAFEGDYQDIFTGVCCEPVERKKRSIDDDDILVTMYEFTVSNDGNSYGEQNSVYAYDTICIEQDQINGNIKFALKDDFCFIDGSCFIHNDKLLAPDECYLCNPTVDPYNWTKGNCDETEATGLTTTLIAIIIVGSGVAVTVTAVLIYLLCLKKTKNHRAVHDSHTNLQSTLASFHLSKPAKFKDNPAHTRMDGSRLKGCTKKEHDMISTFPDINTTDAAKPICKPYRWTISQSLTEIETGIGETNHDGKAETAIDSQDNGSNANIDIEMPVSDTGNEQHTLDVVTTISVKSLE